jgi:hypothetical protein
VLKQLAHSAEGLGDAAAGGAEAVGAALGRFAQQGLELGEGEEDQKTVRGTVFSTQVERLAVGA